MTVRVRQVAADRRKFNAEMCRDIDNVSVRGRWPLTTGVAQGRYYCSANILLFFTMYKCGRNGEVTVLVR